MNRACEPRDQPLGEALPVDACPNHPEMAEAWRQSKVLYLKIQEGLETPVRVFGECGPMTPVVLVHGLQSHSGWFVQSGRYLAGLGYPVYAFDRRGSGLSRQPRGHTTSYEQMLCDLARVAEYAVQGRSDPRVHLLGHCFGAIPASLFAQQQPQRVRSLILTTPGLYTRVTVPLRMQMWIAWSRWTGVQVPVPVPYPEDSLTDQPSYRRFIQADHLALTALTSSFFFEVRRARRSLIRRCQRFMMPVFMALAGNDTLADNRKNHLFYERTAAQCSRIVTYRRARHILEFSAERDAFFTDLGNWVRRVDRDEAT